MEAVLVIHVIFTKVMLESECFTQAFNGISHLCIFVALINQGIKENI
jgi:hypothetical protein